MKLRDYAEKYYHRDFNCAESILLAANEKYQLNIDQADIPLISGFGGGMAVEGPCGALTGGVAALGKLIVKTRAHQSDDLKRVIQQYIASFNARLGSDQCGPLKARHQTAQKGCIETVLLAADVLEESFDQLG